MGPHRADIAALVLAAGAGSRLAPLSTVRPKPLCPVGNVALLDLAVARVADALRPPGPDDGSADVASSIAINISHGRDAFESHLDASPWGRQVHRSIEPTPLGTAGAVGPLRDWIDGRALLIVNGDTWAPASLRALVEGWDGERIAVAVSGTPPLHARSAIVASVLPWADVRTVAPEPAGLWERFWRQRLAGRRLVSIGIDGPFVDCGTPADYLRANMACLEHAVPGRASTVGHPPTGSVGRRVSGSLIDPSATVSGHGSVESSVVGAGAQVEGRILRCVLWPSAAVGAEEELIDCVRTEGGLTVGPGAPSEGPAGSDASSG